MPSLTTETGSSYDETGAGSPVIFVHEFAGDCEAGVCTQAKGNPRPATGRRLTPLAAARG
jgi:hypothetical protein